MRTYLNHHHEVRINDREFEFNTQNGSVEDFHLDQIPNQVMSTSASSSDCRLILTTTLASSEHQPVTAARAFRSYRRRSGIRVPYRRALNPRSSRRRRT